MPRTMNQDQLSIAEALIEAVAVFPCDPRSKAPLVRHGFKAASRDPEQIREWWGEYPDAIPGIATGSVNGISVLDIDVKKGVNGFHTLERLGFDYEEWEVFVQKTRSGGRHIYFNHSDDLRSNAGKIGPGLDTRAEGGYVCFYGSRRDAEKLAMHLICGSLPEFPDELIPPPADRMIESDDRIPRWESVVDALNSIPNRKEDGIERDEYRDILFAFHHGAAGNPGAEKIARAWAKQHSSYTAENFSSDWNSAARKYEGDPIRVATLFRVATDAGWTPQFVDCTAADFLEPGEDPAEELLQHHREVRKAEKAREEAETSHLTILTPAECGAFEPRPYVIKGLISEGEVGQIIAPPNVGKSLFAAHMLYSVAQGKETFGMRVRQGPVLYVAPEDEYGMRQRVNALRLEHGDAPDFHLVGNVSNLAAEKKDFKALSKLVRQIEPKLIVIDTLRSGFPDAEENSSDGMAKVAAVAQSLARSGAAVIIIHHGGKSDDARGRGSEALYGAADMSMHLSENNGVVEGRLPKVRNGRKDRTVSFTIESRIIGRDCDGDPVEVPICIPLDIADAPRRSIRLNEAQEVALSILTAMRGQASKDDFRAACLSNPSICKPDSKPDSQTRAWRRICQELAEKGLIKSRGDYFVVIGSGADLFPDDEADGGYEY